MLAQIGRLPRISLAQVAASAQRVRLRRFDKYES